LRQIDNEENDFVVSVLDLFEGQITLDEIMSVNLDRLYALIRAKERFIVKTIEKRKQQQELEALKKGK
jgi:fructose 1,6-bisphosphatase